MEQADGLSPLHTRQVAAANYSQAPALTAGTGESSNLGYITTWGEVLFLKDTCHPGQPLRD